MTTDYYGNSYDDAGHPIGSDYYHSQAWADAKAANDALQAAADAYNAAARLAEQSPTPTNVAVMQTANDALWKTANAYSQVGGTADQPELNAGLVLTAVTEANRALDAVGLPPLPIPAAPQYDDDPFTPGVPGGPIDPEDPTQQDEWTFAESSAAGSLETLVAAALAGFFAFRLFR